MAAANTDLYSLGLSLDPSSMVQGATQAEQALGKLATASEQTEAASQKVTASAKEQGKAHDDLGDAIEHHHLRLGLLERGLISLTAEMTGASHELLHMGAALSEFATGGEFLVGALAGITALSAVWDKLAEETKAAQKAAEDYAKSAQVQEYLNAQRRESGLQTTDEKIAEQTKEALKNALAGTEVHGGPDMFTTSMAGLRQLAVGYAEGKIAAEKFDEEMANIGRVVKQVDEDVLTKAWNTVRILGTAFEDASRHAEYHAKVIQITGMSEQELADYTERLTEKYAKFGEAVKAAGEAAEKSNAQILGSNLTNNGLVSGLDEMFKQMHAPLEQMSKMWQDDLKEIGKLATPAVDSFVKAEIEALNRQEAAAQQAVERPFREAMRSITHDFGNFFADVLGGGAHTFQKFADSIRDTFAHLVAQLAEMKLAQAMLSPNALAALGIPLAPGQLQMHTQLFGALGVAGVSGTLGYGIGSSTGTGAFGGALGGAASGAAMGSIIPGIGTAAGAVIGGVVGAIGGAFGSAAKHHQEAVERALREAEEEQVRSDAHLRALQAEGRTYEAESAQLAASHEKELFDLRQRGYDAATLSAVTFAQAAEDAALAADQARRKQQDAANAIAQEGSLFGESSAATQARLAALYGFGGKSRDEILGMYARYTPGHELTADQQSLNTAIQNYLSQYLQPGGTTSSTTLGSVSSISAAQSDVMVGLMTSQVMFLSRIATATESLAGTGSIMTATPNGSVSGAAVDKALAARAMTRRAAVGAVRGPSPA